MHTTLAIPFIALLSLTNAVSLKLRNAPDAQCGTCNPTAGQNLCDVSTSCIATGMSNYCACRAGYKAVAGQGDPSVQFRLTGADFENRVFVPTGVSCDVLCDDPYAGPGPNGLCSEVILTTCAP
ncbi:uncharacterized protein HMPREF1541_06913 [Cyphellophora europaea CBS 101466]|uniref:EGF-like calcium-binding domain-containing protein n=1 Tax=Cyphellophora europaea (strain CBS 101466) TaxID=1220924 RepID=W2RR04_CYPE1|nr:uncharacterized protein HMPREF1541_06913 [Cyphellophora europaea CBS 101466]ETN38872.1 hypothetical protein HMPREF1541_06913 [Cyphellophora europaea CBS 101466]